MRNVICRLGLLTLASLPTNAFATPDQLRAKLDELAVGLVKVAAEKSLVAAAFSVGAFTPTGLPNTSSGPGIETLLTEALERAKKGIVSPDAPLEIKGDFGFFKSKSEPGLKEARIIARVLEKDTSEELISLRAAVALDGTAAIAHLLQISATLPPDGTKEERNRKLDEAAKKPSAHANGTRTFSSPGSPYAVEVLARAKHDTNPAQPRAVELKKGQAFVTVERDELYEVKLYNDSDREAAVALSVDGVDVFHFSDDRGPNGAPKFRYFIIAPRSATTVVGWHKSLSRKEFLSFLVTALGQGAASKAGLASLGKIGVIHAQFSHCKPLGPGKRSTPGNETGFGPPRTVEQRAVEYEVEPPHDFVSVRYTR